MDSVAFASWIVGIRRLDASQRGRAFQELALAEANDLGASDDGATGAAAPPGEPQAVQSVAPERMSKAAPGQTLLSRIGQDRLASFGCPHCGGDDVRPWGKAGGKPRYRCASCRKTFNPLTGTPLAGLHHPDRWPDQARALIAGETVAKAAETLRRGLHHRVPVETSVPVGAQSRQAAVPVRDRRGGRDLHPGILQGQTPRSTEIVAQAGRQGHQAGAVGGADPGHRRPRPHRCDHRCRPAAARRRQHHAALGRSLPGPRNCAATEVRRSPHSLGAPGSSSMSCPRRAFRCRKHLICTSTT